MAWHVNQRAHALQAALLAEQAGCDAALVTAALLHDIGHMVHDLGETPPRPAWMTVMRSWGTPSWCDISARR